MKTPARTATKPKQVIIIPVSSHGLRASLFKRQGTRPLFVLLSLLAMLIVLHMLASANLPPASDCASLLHTTNYVNTLQLHAPDQLGAIAYQEGLIPGRPVALVPTLHQGKPGTEDITVFSCNPQARTPGLLHITSWPGLINPGVGISRTGSLLISSQGGDSQLPHQIYHEYSWQRNAFVEIAFPGLYPVLSRAEAEQLQKQASVQDNLPWHDPRSTAEQLALQLFGWSRADFAASIQTLSATSASVSLLHRNPTINVVVSLQQLIDPNPGGLWFVTGARTPGLLLAQPVAAASVPASIVLQGSGIQSGGQLGLRLLDSGFQVIHGSTPGELSIDSHGHFAGSLSMPGSAAHQPGLLLISSAGMDKPLQSGQMLLRKLLLQ